MGTIRNTYRLRHGQVIDVVEYHDGKYGAPGKNRSPRAKPTKEQMARQNAMNKTRRCRQRLLQYFDDGDCFATWTYEPSRRPEDMTEAVRHFRNAIGKVRREYRKRGKDLFWIRNIEKGTRGAWHIHLVVNEIGDTASILKEAWKHGGVYISEIRLNDKIYDEDFSKLASYMTKDAGTAERKKDGGKARPRISEANYSTSRNMPLPEPEKKKLVRWQEEPKPKKGYYITSLHEGINPVTGYRYRRYTMIRMGGNNDNPRVHKKLLRGSPDKK